ncbi:MAG: VOC family protein [Fimbriimonadaceae bacterium]|nr:hypothetical protein [Fimbriimonadaceae bacterium]MCC6352203.1 VOC family protein [Fimbriimonadaceae bacterium]MCL4285275.1 VOC family protein [Fimbriimonadaceae bacterium]QOJ11926.1 MAG: VOC family protein [Chthonomonadaceae bacterium]
MDKAGAIIWHDLTVSDAEQLRDFYASVMGWIAEPHDMESYCDFDMKDPESGATVAGVCHARGLNAGIPPQWMMYVQVADLAASLARCVELGGEVIHGPRAPEEGGYAIVKDPAGAVCAIVQGKNGQ